ncbi:MAG: VCBS repeat-containing protein [Polyangiales bacterium]
MARVPAVADLDGDGRNEVIVARAGRVAAFRADGTALWSYAVPGAGGCGRRRW